MSFRLDLFRAELEKADHGFLRSFKANKSWMGDLLAAVERGAQPAAVQTELNRVPADKQKKYAKAIEYLKVHYPLPRAALTPIPRGSNFMANYSARRGDIIYGLVAARAHYAGRFPGAEDYACDDYNNYFGVSGGVFRADADRNRVNANLQNQKQQLHARGGAYGPPATPRYHNLELFDAYYETLQGPQFHPQNVLSLPAERVAKEAGGNLRTKQINKAIRRACKCGLYMIATHPQFVNSGAKIHFVLDRMGDLGVVAKKLGRERGRFVEGGNVPITTSELRYCFRRWEVVQRAVWFYVNFQRVQPPWLERWTLTDCEGHEVKSGFHEWQDYAETRIAKDQAERGIG